MVVSVIRPPRVCWKTDLIPYPGAVTIGYTASTIYMIVSPGDEERSIPNETPVTTSQAPPLSSSSMRRFSAFVCGFSSMSGRVSGTAVWWVVDVEVVWWLKTTVSAGSSRS
jgi:hypothetical protein